MIGRQPVQNFTIETISDYNDLRLTKFRREIFEFDLKIDPDLVSIDKDHNWWVDNFNKKISEDAWKYCDKKWKKVGFDNIEAIIEDNNIVGMSGCRKYKNYLRTSMHLYLLKSVRAKYPGIKYLEGGWFQRHMKYANTNNCSGMFFTVYAYSRKLQGLINNHRGKIISLVDKSHLLYINDIHEKGEYIFNGVPQTFFYYPLTLPIEEFNPNDFV